MMSKIISVLLTLTFVFALSATAVNANDGFTNVSYENEEDDSENYVEGQVLFSYTKSAVELCSIGEAKSVSQDGEEIVVNDGNSLADCGIESMKEISRINTSTSFKAQSLSYTAIYVANVSTDVKEACKKLEKVNGVNAAEPNYLSSFASVSMPEEVSLPTDSYSKYQKWWMNDRTELPLAWEKYDTLGSGVTVAVLDSGLNTDNEEIHNNLWTDAQGHCGYNAVEDSYDISPDNGHGANVTGILAQISNGYHGVGVAPESKVMAIKISHLNENEDKTQSVVASNADMISGIEYAITNKADIISISLLQRVKSQLVYDECKKAYDSSVLVVACAGNDGKATSSGEIAYPAGFDCVIGVMGTDKSGYLANLMNNEYSNYDDIGGYYNISAPAVNIYGLSNGSSAESSLGTGTSQATPIVAGIAALYMSCYPDSTISDVWDAICNSSSTFCPVHEEQAQTDLKVPEINAIDVLSYKHADIVKDTGVTLSQNRLSLSCGESSKLSANVLPENATEKSVTWISPNYDIASVEYDGTVKALSRGVIRLKIQTSCNNTSSCLIEAFSQGENKYETLDRTLNDAETDYTITEYTGSDSYVEIPQTILDIPVTKIGEFAFKNSNATKIKISDNVTYISDDAFDGITDKITIYGYDDTYACEYAKAHGIKFVTLGLNEITVSKLPNKLNYNYKQSLDTTGIVVTAKYSDGKTKDITSDCTYTPLKFTTNGTQNVTVFYKDEATNKVYSAKYQVKVSYTWWQWIIVILLFGWIWY